jgi:hypothetical protein
MNADKQDKNQRLRMVQSLYRKKKHNEVKRDEDRNSKIWTVFIVISVLFALFILITNELVVVDPGIPIPEFLLKFLPSYPQHFISFSDPYPYI